MRRAPLVACALLFGACVTLPKHVDRPVSHALADTAATALGRLVAPAAAAHPAESGFVLLNAGDAALAARVALCELAQASIDAQYFEWAGDALGRVMLAHVIAAADRGVRVRLLIDDYNARGHDIAFEALDAHPNIEVRVFNPFARGRLRLPQLIGRFTELNHRMHNKLFVVDGQAAVVGGRNLTDAYFGLARDLDFRDFDLFAVGAVVPRAEAAFDAYWNSRWAYPIAALRKHGSPEALARSRARFDARLAADRARLPYSVPRDAADARAFVERWRGRATWAVAEVVWDDPSVMAQPIKGTMSTVGQKLLALVRQSEREIVVENAYLVPRKDALALRELTARGVDVQLLTNSLASTDVISVNAAYARARPTLAELGVALYELKPFAASRALYVADAARSPAHLALHGKAAVLDRAVVFLGSFNLDPRSLYLDTEAVFVVYSPALAAQLLDAFAVDFRPENAWRIGWVVGQRQAAWITKWRERADVEPHDPASLWRRMMRALAGVLPLRSLL